MKRGIILSDLHCGHMLGLAHPDDITGPSKLKKIRQTFWNWWTEHTTKSWDFCLCNGDAIDGEGAKGNRNHDTTDIGEQIERAADILKGLKAKKYFMTYGTEYHSGKVLDYEKQIAIRLGADIRSEQNLEIDGLRITASHHMGKSGVPRGGDLQLKGKTMWKLISERSNVADLVISSHVHECRWAGVVGLPESWTTPALQLPIKDFYPYARRLNGFSAVGFLELVVRSRTDYDIIKHIFQVQYDCGGYIKL